MSRGLDGTHPWLWIATQILVNATSIDCGICAAPTTTAERPQTTVLFFQGGS
jgi:hypothetical protein